MGERSSSCYIASTRWTQAKALHCQHTISASVVDSSDPQMHKRDDGVHHYWWRLESSARRHALLLHVLLRQGYDEACDKMSLVGRRPDISWPNHNIRHKRPTRLIHRHYVCVMESRRIVSGQASDT